MATVIKSSDLKMATARPAPFNLLDIEAEARQIVASARQQAERDYARTMADARAKAAKIETETRTRAQQEGYEKGLGEGRTAGHDEAFRQATEKYTQQQAGLTEACKNIIYRFDEQKNRLLLAARTDMIRLALTIVQRVVGLVEADAELSQRTAIQHATAALELVGSHSTPVLHVNPKILDAMETFAAGLSEAAHASQHVRVVADETIPPGGCVLTTPEGRVDATLETQVNRIAALLVGQSEEELVSDNADAEPTPSVDADVTPSADAKTDEEVS